MAHEGCRRGRLRRSCGVGTNPTASACRAQGRWPRCLRLSMCPRALMLHFHWQSGSWISGGLAPAPDTPAPLRAPGPVSTGTDTIAWDDLTGSGFCRRATLLLLAVGAFAPCCQALSWSFLPLNATVYNSEASLVSGVSHATSSGSGSAPTFLSPCQCECQRKLILGVVQCFLVVQPLQLLQARKWPGSEWASTIMNAIIKTKAKQSHFGTTIHLRSASCIAAWPKFV
jgi:hypothetical protein